MVGWLNDFNMENRTFYDKFKTSIFLLGFGETLNKQCICTHSTFAPDSCPSSRSSTLFLNWVSEMHSGWQTRVCKRDRVRWGHDFSDCRLQTPMGIFLGVWEGYKVSCFVVFMLWYKYNYILDNLIHNFYHQLLSSNFRIWS